jgi:hypothetical protein
MSCDVVETVAISDIFISGCARIERAGGDCVRFYFYAQQGDEKILVCKAVVPNSVVRGISAMKEQLLKRGYATESELVAH